MVVTLPLDTLTDQPRHRTARHRRAITANEPAASRLNDGFRSLTVRNQS